MNIQKIFTNHSSKSAFRSNITFDIGGSQREGSCKIDYSTSGDGAKIYTARTTVNKLGKTTFRDADDFIHQIVKKVKTVQDNNISNVKDMGYPASENVIRSTTLFLPSYTDEDFAYYLPNHRDDKGVSLRNLDFSNITKRLAKAGIKVDPNMRFTLLQDAMGTGLATAKTLFDNGMLEKGKAYTACITGGGCGIANIERLEDDCVHIKSSGSACIPNPDGIKKVSALGASAPAVIRNFCKEFGLNNETTQEIAGCFKAEFTLEDPVMFDKRDNYAQRLKQLLLDTGKYEEVQDDAAAESNKFILEVKPEFKDLYNRSRKKAIDKYARAFACLASIKRNDGSNGLVITGPVARAIARVAKENYGKDLSTWVTEILLENYTTEEIKCIQNTYDFKIICDDRFFIDDNTACRQLAHKINFIAPHRSNWITISVDDLKKCNAYI